MNDSFGWSYYGFFVAVIIWLAAYFFWARLSAGSPRKRSPR